MAPNIPQLGSIHSTNPRNNRKRRYNSDADTDEEGFTPKSGSPSMDDDRRAHHNELERRRRDHIKDHFIALKNSIPLLEGEKSSRALILKRAVDYITLLQAQLKEAKFEIEDQKRKNDLLRHQSTLSLYNNNPINQTTTVTLHQQQQQQQQNITFNNNHSHNNSIPFKCINLPSTSSTTSNVQTNFVNNSTVPSISPIISPMINNQATLTQQQLSISHDQEQVKQALLSSIILQNFGIQSHQITPDISKIPSTSLLINRQLTAQL